MRTESMRTWWWVVALFVALYLAPTDAAGVVVFLLGVGSMAWAGRGLRRAPVVPKGFVAIYVGAVLMVVSMIVRAVHAASVGEVFPYPSPADVPAVAGYLVIIYGTVALARARRAFGGQGDAVDTLILAIALAAPFWIGVLGEYFADSSFSVQHRTLSGIYAVTEVAFAAVVFRLAAGPGRRNQSFRHLATSIAAITLLDVVAILDTIGQPGGSFILPFAAVGYVSFARACNADDLEQIIERPPASDPRLTTSRLATIALGVLSIPVIVVLDLGGSGSLVTIAFVSVLAFLVLMRVIRLLRSRDRIADYDVALRASGQDLIASESIDEIIDVTETTIRGLCGEARVALIIRNTPGAGVLIAGATDRPLSRGTTSWDSSDDATRLADVLGPVDDPALVTVIPLGKGGAVGSLRCVPERPLVHAQQLALQTLAAQTTMAVQSLRTRELTFQRRAEQRLRALVEQSADVSAVLNDDGLVSFISPNAEGMLGHTLDELVGGDPLSIVHADEAVDIATLLRSPSTPDQPSIAIEARLRAGDGTFRWFSLTARDFSDDPEVGGVVLTARDITEERAAKLGLLRSEQWFRGLVQNSSDVIAVLDENGVFTYASPAVTHLTGFNPSELQGRTFTELLPADDAESLERVRRAIRAKPPGVRNLELMVERPDHSRRMTEVTITDRRDDPSVQGLVLNIRDITDRKRLEEDLRHQVLHDDLTGLGSRVQFSNQLQAALAAPRRDHSMVAALFIDIDDFKTINDSLGHAAGDQVLVDISGRLRSKLRLHDNAARFGGDEFAVLLTDVYGESDVTLVADRIVEELRQPVMLMGQEVHLSVSVGIALDEDGTTTPEDLLRAADVAMYEAKDQGKGRWAMFEASMADQTLERFEINNSLAHAIDNDELMVHYQPIVDLGSGRTVGVEALVRWNHPVRGMISPGQFIPIAERNGMIVPIGRWVLEQAATQVAAWRARGHDLYASVNVSAVQLQRDGIVQEVLDVVDRADIDRRAIVLELTESALISDFDLVNRRIDALRDAGLRVAIDDFGTGYATLTYADQFAADILKIDQSFVARLENSDDSAIVTTVLNIAAAMGAETVAEGIEVPDQHRRLLSLGCSLGQGYYFKRPAPADAISESLARELDGEALAGHGH